MKEFPDQGELSESGFVGARFLVSIVAMTDTTERPKRPLHELCSDIQKPRGTRRSDGALYVMGL